MKRDVLRQGLPPEVPPVSGSFGVFFQGSVIQHRQFAEIDSDLEAQGNTPIEKALSPYATDHMSRSPLDEGKHRFTDLPIQDGSEAKPSRVATHALPFFRSRRVMWQSLFQKDRRSIAGVQQYTDERRISLNPTALHR